MVVTLKTTLADLDRATARAVRKLDPPTPYLKIWGQSTAKRARNTARGKGGRSFWRAIASSVNLDTVSADSVSVNTAHVAAAQKEFGGEIRPRTKRALTIPISAEAKRKTVADFTTGGRQLFVLPSKKPDTIGVLGYTGAGDRFHALFVLRTRVRQHPDPWWPTPAETLADGIAAAKHFVQRAISSGSST